MFHRFVQFIDSLGEYVSPIAVRDLRRLKHRFILETSILCTLFLLVGLLWGRFELFEYAPAGTDVYWDKAPFVIAAYGILAAISFPMGTLQRDRRTDELLEAVPLSPREQVHGYLQEVCVLMTFVWGLMLPFLTAVFVLRPIPYYYPLIFLEMFFGGIVLFLFALSYSVCTRNLTDTLWFLLFFHVSFLLFFPPWVLLRFLWHSVLHYPVLQWQSAFGFFTFFIALPFGLILLGVLSYFLCLFHFKRRRPICRSLLINGVVYVSFSLVSAVLYLMIAVIAYAL